MPYSPDQIKDKSAAGLGELMIDVRNTFKEPLTEEKLFTWHRMLLRENKRIEVGQWRTHVEPMQVISGAIGKEKVHYEARSSSKVPVEMEQFIHWFNETGPGGKGEIKKPRYVRQSLICTLKRSILLKMETGELAGPLLKKLYHRQ
ncbi:MAG: hypothetical protein WDO16_10455 [Bacteroidota bacterium]